MYSVLDLNYGPHLPEDRKARILDLGCGTGRLLMFLDSRGYANFLGVDIDADALAKVPERLRGRTLIINDLSAFLSAQKGCFDLILAKDVLYYFPRREVLNRMREIAEAIRPGGTVVAEVFNGALLTAPYTASKDLGIQTMYTEHSLSSLLEGAGLNVVKVYGQLQIKGGLLRPLYDCGVIFWRLCLRIIYLIERGLDSQNPRILTKSILAVARRPLG